MSGPAGGKRRMNIRMINPSQATANTLWSWLVAGLILAMLLSLGALIWFSATGKKTDTLVTIFTALLTGLLGIFAPSPGGN